MRVLSGVLASVGLYLGAWSCGPSHCGYNSGDSACAARDPGAPFCDLCVQENDGCVSVAPSDAACVLVTDSGAPPPAMTMSVTLTATSEPGGPSTTPDPSPPDTTEDGPPEPTTGTTDTSTTTSDDTTSTGDTSTTTSDDTTADDTTSTTADDTTSDDTTSTTADDTTGPQPPMCGNDVIEDAEQCDGPDLAGQTCVGLGQGGGTLVCSAMCTYDLGGCCLADGKACGDDGECCSGNCAFDLLMFKDICK